MKNKLKIGFLLSFFLLTAFLSVAPSYALSTETTGISYYGWSTNQHRYATAGGFHIFVSAAKLMFYDSDGALAKTWDLPHTNSYGTVILAKNDTALYVYTAYEGGVDDGDQLYVLDVATLTYSEYTLYDASCGTWNSTEIMGINIVETGLGVYGISGTRLTQPDWYLSQLSGTPANVLYNITGTSAWNWWGPAITVPSETDTNIFYVLCRNYEGGTRFSVYKVDVNTPSITLLGTSGIDNTWGDYVYFIGSSYDTDGSSVWYDVGVVYNNPSVNKDIYPQVCRFNDTYVGYARSTLSASSAVNLLRCMSVPYSGVRSNMTLLLEGDYRFVYVGTSYAMMQCPFTIDDLDTNAPSVSITYSPSTYQGVSHYYNTSGVIGGYQPETIDLAFMLDYANGKCIVDNWIATNPSVDYVFIVNPTPISYINDYDFIIAKDYYYTYTGELFTSQTLVADGYYKLYYALTDGGAWTLFKTGAMTDGVFSFTFAVTTSEIWWELNITRTDINETATYTVNHYIIGSDLPPGGTPSPSGIDEGYIGSGVAVTLGYLVPMMFILGPALLLGVKIGMPGFMGGLMVGFGIWSLINPLAIALVVVVVFAAIIMLFYSRGRSEAG